MSFDFNRETAAAFVSATATRLVLFLSFPSLANFLTGRVEISTPVTSFKRLQEGILLYSHNVSPYDGGVFYQAPLLLPLFSLIPATAFALITDLIFILLDLTCAYALLRITQSGLSGNEKLFQSPRRGKRWTPTAVAAAYLFNPLTIASCLGRSTLLFTNCCILIAIWKATERKHHNSALALAVASYLSLYPVLLVPPIALLCSDERTRDVEGDDKSHEYLRNYLATFAGATGILLGLSSVVTGGSWEFLASTYGNHLLMADLTPNVGLWWYFFIEMFDSFREFFLGVFWLHLAAYVGGFCIRLRRQPLFITTTMLGITAIFKPYPSVSDASLYLALFPLYQHVFPLMRYSFLAVSVILYSSLLGPAFYYLWIHAGSGNANFFYAITLVWSLGLSVTVGDSLWAVLRDEWEVERPGMKGRQVKQI